MKKKNEITTQTGCGPAIRISFKDGPRPYFLVETCDKAPLTYGYIEDDDVDRLRRMCERALKSRRSVKTTPKERL